jgi:hypothetical protein
MEKAPILDIFLQLVMKIVVSNIGYGEGLVFDDRGWTKC